MKAHHHLIRWALDRGCSISVWDTEEWACKRCTDHDYVLEASEQADESELVIHDQHGQRLGWAYVICYDLLPEEMVVDMTANEFMNRWQDAFEKETGQ